MRHFAVQQFARLALCATLGQCVLACGADTDHGPIVGSPTGPGGPTVNEGGGSNATGGAGPATSAGTGASPVIDATSGGARDGRDSGGASSLGAAGVDRQFGSGGLGSGGFSVGSDPFARAGGLNFSTAGSFF